MTKGVIRQHQDLEVYQLAFEAAMQIFELSKQFPIEERSALTDQMRRSSRSVVQTWQKLGVNDATKQLLLQN